MPDELNSQSVNSNSTSSNKIDLQQERIERVNIIVQDSTHIQQAGNSYQVNYNKILELNAGFS